MSTLQPTSDQQSAITIHDQNLIVVAGAGSGKTRVLVERYLSLLEANPDWSLNALVAITFTREAALEMRNRVREELETRLREDGNERWSALLGQMDSARIDTIHGLCATILRANAAEAGVDPGFEVLDETEAAILLETVVADVLQSLSSDELELFSEYDSPTILNILTRADLMSITIQSQPENLMDIWQQEWEIGAAKHIRELIPLIEVNIWEPQGDDTLSKGWNVCQQIFTLLSDSTPLPDLIHEIQGIVKTIRLPGVPSTKVWGDDAPQVKADLSATRDEIVSALKAIGDPPGEPEQRAAEVLPLWEKLISTVQDRYYKAKQQQSLLDFDDLEQRTRDVLYQHNEVQERYRNAEFRHIMVDEFQDTNQLQWQIVQRLGDLATGGSLFVVGDPKQSIYQFRGADVSVFHTVRDEIAEQAAGRKVLLSRSFRTHPKLINIFNHLFQQILVQDVDSPVRNFQVAMDGDMDAHRQSAPDGATLELLLLDKNGRDRENQRKSKLSSEMLREWEATELASRFQEMITTETPVFDKQFSVYRPIKFGDFAILFQSMSHVTEYEAVFKAMQIPFVTIAGRGYYSRQEVWDLLNLLRALHNQADDLSLAVVLRSPMFGFSDDLLFALRRMQNEDGNRLSLWDALSVACEESVVGITEDDQELVRSAYSCLANLQTVSGRVTISELLRQALAQTGYLAILTGLPDGKRRRGNVEKLLTIAETSGKVTPGEFTRYLDDVTAREVREGEATLDTDDAVRLMTVHASKGLEFPVVVLADASWVRRGGGSPTILVQDDHTITCRVYDTNENKYVDTFAYRRMKRLQELKEEAERKRLLYVAATRAQNYLIISGVVSQDKKIGWRSGGWLDKILETLELRDWDAQDSSTVICAGEEVRLWLPHYDAEKRQHGHEEALQDAWKISDEALASYEMVEPPLLKTVRVTPDAPLRHLAATQLADIGGVKHASQQGDQAFYQQRFRRKAFHDAPSQIRDIQRERKPRVSRRIIGDIVHEALRYWYFPHNTDDIDQTLRGYAWQRGLSHDHEMQQAVSESRRLLERFQQSDLYGWIDEARKANINFYPELPFVFRTDRRIIHGIIDLLFKRDDSWIVIDYKTSYVPNNDLDEQAVANHARRYHLQVGAYASAVMEQLGENVVPKVFIHYIRHTQTVEIPAAQWQTEISRLEEYIGDLLRTDR